MKFRGKKDAEVALSSKKQSAAETGSVNETGPHSSSTSLENIATTSLQIMNESMSRSEEIVISPGVSTFTARPMQSDAAAASSSSPSAPNSSSPTSSSPSRPKLQHSVSAPSLVSLQGFLKYIAERGRNYADRQRWRLVMKDGTCNVSSMHITERKRKYLVDLFTTVVDMKWRYNLLMFAMGFLVSWLGFALIWWVIAVANGDTDPNRYENHTVCVGEVYDFQTALLFSIETQHTIGYGFRCITTNCISALLILMIQSCVGVFITCLITGIVFSKLSRPKSRAQTIMFSRQAVICRREGRHCLLFRVGDMRKSHIIGTSIRAMVVRDRVTSEGECIPLCQSPLKVETEMGGSGDTFAFLVWPATVTHVIDEESPLWDISADQLISSYFEIIVILEGTIESNGKAAQFRTSYLPSEILWGHRLAPLLTYQTTKGTYDVDYKQFNGTIPITMTEQSAKQTASVTSQDDDDQQQKPFYQNTEKDSSISLVRSQGIGQPMEISTPRRLYRRFKSAPYNTETQER